jgi:hypothetical protein
MLLQPVLRSVIRVVPGGFSGRVALGSRRVPTRVTKATPQVITISPTGEKSKSLKGSRPFSRSASLTRMLGGVPIMVVNPPSSDP